jgi:hypothetical protein
MKTKPTKFRLTLDTEIEVYLSNFDFCGMNEKQIKQEIIKSYLSNNIKYELKVELVNEKTLLTIVQANMYQEQCDFYRIELERELTSTEHAEILNWIAKGQNYNLYNEIMK